jgi:cytochrome b involved in lipid metabolism
LIFGFIAFSHHGDKLKVDLIHYSLSMKYLAVILLGSLALAGCTAAPSNNNTSGSSSSSSSASTTYTLADVAKHSTGSDCWMAIEGRVYDVTAFISRHPGGNEILRGCGKDATQLFETQGGEGSHSSTAREILNGLQIGTLAN